MVFENLVRAMFGFFLEHHAGVLGRQGSLGFGCGMGILYKALVRISVKAFSISRLPAYCLFTIMVALFLGFVIFDIHHFLSRLVRFFMDLHFACTDGSGRAWYSG